MKKSSLFLLPALLLAAGFNSCDDNDGKKTPDEDLVEISNGIYVINNGNQNNKIPSSITAYNYDSGAVTPVLEDAFKDANGIALGSGAQPGIVYGSKMYIPMYESNLIWVVNPYTLKIIDTIRPTGEATGPRALTSADGKVYASMYTGYVCRIDTSTLQIDKTLQTGPNPEQMAVAGGKLYVANSDGFNYEAGYTDCSISIVDLASFTESKIKDITKVLNPTDVVSNGTDVFVICKGNYLDIPSMVKKIVGNDVEDVALGNFMSINGNKLYVINNVYGAPRADMAFDVYNTTTLQKEGLIAKQAEGSESWVDSPAAIDVDPVTGDIVIISYTVTADGKSQYYEPCYANIYDNAGNFKKRIMCGVGPEGMTFVHKPTSK